MVNWWRALREAPNYQTVLKALDAHAVALRANTEAIKRSDEAPTYPSLDIVRAELDVEAGSVERRASGIDTKAGQLLGFAGVLVGVIVNKGVSSSVQAAGLIFAVLAGLTAIFALLPRAGSSVNPQALREAYLTSPAEATRLVVLDTRIVLHQQDEKDLRKKRNRLFGAVVLLFVAVVLVAAGPTIGVLKGDQHGGTSTSTVPSAARPTTTARPQPGQPGRG